MTTRIRDLDGQRSFIIESRENTIFWDDGLECFEFDKGILLNALRRELADESGCVCCGGEKTFRCERIEHWAAVVA